MSFTLIRLRHRRHEDNILCMTTSRDGQYLLTGGEGGVVAVWRTFDLNLLYTYPTCDGSIRSVALSHCHQFVLTGELGAIGFGGGRISVELGDLQKA